MEGNNHQYLDSPSKNSYIGSYYQPPDRIASVSRQLEFPAHPSVDISETASHPSGTTRNIDSKAVVDALKTLQQKIRRLELERKHGEQRHLQFSIGAQRHHQLASSHCQTTTTTSLPGTDNSAQKEVDEKLQSAEARCKILEKQLDYMKKMVENAKRGRSTLMENQASLQSQQTSRSSNRTQQEKLEKLESEYLKLSRTQTEAEMKLALLEQKLLKEEHERKLVQEKADELQRELDVNLRLPVQQTTTKNKTSKQDELASGSQRHKKVPFVAGTSTSPSHSVHANVQTILHMMKHHQPQLCERVSTLHRSGCGAKKNLRKEFSTSFTAFQKPGSLSVDQSLGSLSDLLLALQDELGQMSFEHQELERLLDATQHREQRDDLQRELERLVARMEEKGAQITKLRKHQHMVHQLTQSQSRDEDRTAKKPSGIRPPVPSPVKTKQKTKKSLTCNNLQLLRETQKFRNSLKQDDLFWET
ncbi:centrosomal protein CEP57L1 [Cololabis saira]|uniref:centrosomal protein CEP57L1 n=1 Tax=Cololabis saira TaxID=129043 RepID=UPI002AD41418|nr:centrosomal protein CEP57L1 [Cololabis saira]